ncbi:hypothetical protein BDW22DRAFT_1358484 [Trametopsis cervina]|nr:hypothetical protein BDW22DRAFT_1358484 [Trametopsis cervina]
MAGWNYIGTVCGTIERLWAHDFRKVEGPHELAILSLSRFVIVPVRAVLCARIEPKPVRPSTSGSFCVYIYERMIRHPPSYNRGKMCTPCSRGI